MQKIKIAFNSTTNPKTNFTYLKNEITNLESKEILEYMKFVSEQDPESGKIKTYDPSTNMNFLLRLPFEMLGKSPIEDFVRLKLNISKSIKIANNEIDDVIDALKKYKTKGTDLSRVSLTNTNNLNLLIERYLDNSIGNKLEFDMLVSNDVAKEFEERTHIEVNSFSKQIDELSEIVEDVHDYLDVKNSTANKEQLRIIAFFMTSLGKIGHIDKVLSDSLIAAEKEKYEEVSESSELLLTKFSSLTRLRLFDASPKDLTTNDVLKLNSVAIEHLTGLRLIGADYMGQINLYTENDFKIISKLIGQAPLVKPSLVKIGEFEELYNATYNVLINDLEIKETKDSGVLEPIRKVTVSTNYEISDIRTLIGQMNSFSLKHNQEMINILKKKESEIIPSRVSAYEEPKARELLKRINLIKELYEFYFTYINPIDALIIEILMKLKR